jgi:hypothetical protein
MFILVVWTQLTSSFNFIWPSYLSRGFSTEIPCSLTCSVLTNLHGWSVLVVQLNKHPVCVIISISHFLYYVEMFFALFWELDVFGLHKSFLSDFFSCFFFFVMVFQKFCVKICLSTWCICFSALPEIRKQHWKWEWGMMSIDAQFPFLTSCQLQKSLVLQVAGQRLY